MGFVIMPAVVSQGCINRHNYRTARLARYRLAAHPFPSIWLISEIHFAIYSVHTSYSLSHGIMYSSVMAGQYSEIVF